MIFSFYYYVFMGKEMPENWLSFVGGIIDAIIFSLILYHSYLMRTHILS